MKVDTPDTHLTGEHQLLAALSASRAADVSSSLLPRPNRSRVGGRRWRRELGRSMPYGSVKSSDVATASVVINVVVSLVERRAPSRTIDLIVERFEVGSVFRELCRQLSRHDELVAVGYTPESFRDDLVRILGSFPEQVFALVRFTPRGGPLQLGPLVWMDIERQHRIADLRAVRSTCLVLDHVTTADAFAVFVALLDDVSGDVSDTKFVAFAQAAAAVTAHT